MTFLPYGRQTVEEDDIAAVTAVLRGDWLTTGPTVRQFEDAFAARVGARYAVSVNSGTAALHLATLTAGLGPGDLAIVPSITFLATANAVRYVGAEVLFADVDPDTGLLTAETLTDALHHARRQSDGRVKAVLPVHLKGLPVDSPAMAEIARDHKLLVIEDACHALGTTYGNDEHRVGANAHATMTVFSTHAVKTITTGEGGLVTTEDDGLARQLRRFRSHGMESDSTAWGADTQGFEDGLPAPWYYEMAEIGFNYRLPDINCALGLAQLAKLDRFLARRAQLVARYDSLLAPLTPHLRIPVRPNGCRIGWHLYAVQIDFAAIGLTRSTTMRHLREKGIGTQVHYVPVHTQPYYRHRYGIRDLPGAQRYYDQTLSLPLFPGMTDNDVDRVAEALAEVVAR